MRDEPPCVFLLTTNNFNKPPTRATAKERKMSKRKMSMRKLTGNVAILSAAICVAAALPSFAADGTWVGGTSTDLCEPLNWSGGEVPNGGIATISVASATTLTCSGTFSPSAIVFGADSALVTIDGNVTDILAITNFSPSVHHVFAGTVSFAENTDADVNAASASANYVKYPGGMTAYTLKNASITNFLSGQITLTKDLGDWAQFANIGLLWLKDSGTKLNITHPVLQGAGRSPNFYIESGTTVSITGDLRSKTQFAWLINGTLEASGWVIKDNTGGDVKFATLVCSGYIKAYGIKEATSGQAKDIVWTSTDNINYPPHFILGAGGIPAGTSTMMHDASSGNGELKAFFYAADDYTVEGTIGLGYSGNAKSRWPIWHLYTDNIDGTGGHTITLNCTIGGNTVHRCLRIYGTGTVKVIKSFSNPKGVEIYNTVKLALKPGVTVGVNLTMKDSSTLKVLESGIVDLTGCAVTFQNANNKLAFHVTDRNVAPQLALNASKTTASALSCIEVNVSAAEGIRMPHANSPYRLTTGGCFTGKTVSLAPGAPDWVQRVRIVDGDIYLYAKYKGIMLLVR